MSPSFAHEQRSYLRYGNQTETRYSYQKQNRRLEFLKAGKGDGNLFMDLSYRYDSVGNILGQIIRDTHRLVC